MRLPLEVLAEVRRAVSKDFAVGVRFLGDECIAGGSTVDDAVCFGVAFARAGVDFLSLSRGGKFDDAKQPKVGEAVYPYTGPSGYECMPHSISDERGPFGRNAAPTAAIRRAVRDAGFHTPVVCAGGIHNFDQAEDYLARGEADIVGAARQIARRSRLVSQDPSRPRRSGPRCEYTNYCEALDQKHKQVTCKLWDKEPSAAGERRARDGKRRLTAPAWQPPD